jgi:predicted ferric reductase
MRFIFVILPGAVFYVIDLSLRWLNFFQTDPKLQLLRDVTGDNTVTELQVQVDWKELPAPSSYCLILIPAVGVDAAPHPFSVARFNPETKTASFFCKNVGRMTQRLAESATGFTTDKASKTSIVLMGPYGTPQFDLAAVHSLLLVAGGIGVTPIMFALQWLNSRQALLLRRVEVIWALREEAVAAALEPLISAEMSKLVERNPTVQVQMTVTITSGCKTQNPKFKVGRPDIDGVVNEMNKLSEGEAKGLFCCGPEPLMASCHNAAVFGGFFLHQETFSL